jgi:hypothetical protein
MGEPIAFEVICALEFFQPSLRDSIRLHEVPRTNVLG